MFSATLQNLNNNIEAGLLTTDLLLSAYRQGIFPMAESADVNEIFWLSPDPRAILPLDNFHASKSLVQSMRRNLNKGWKITLDQDFPAVMRACAGTRDSTWINSQILQVYTELFQKNHAHSIEVWRDGIMIGGLYGVAIGGAFFGESMFSTVTDASKIALAALVNALKAAQYQLLDVQFQTDHLRQFGVIEIPRSAYLQRLNEALAIKPFSLRL